VAVVSGSGGLVGSECVRRLVESGWDVIGLECDLRAQFFGPEASTAPVSVELAGRYDEFRWLEIDIRDTSAVDNAFSSEAGGIELVVHAAAQPSHDWAAREPQTDFGVNANGTLNLLEAARRFSP
jgi:CDP-paratose 2-epimerase